MSKLQLIIENSLDENDDGQVKTCFKTFCSKVEDDNREFCYQSIKLEFCNQSIKLAKYELIINWAKTVYPSAISNICFKVEQIFSSFVVSVAFSNILLLLDTKSWPKDDFVSFGNCKINKLTEHYMALLNKNGCDVSKFLVNGPTQWLTFFQCCTIALTNPTSKFGIEYSQIMKWWLSAKASCTSLRSSWLYLLWTP